MNITLLKETMDALPLLGRKQIERGARNQDIPVEMPRVHFPAPEKWDERAEQPEKSPPVIEIFWPHTPEIHLPIESHEISAHKKRGKKVLDFLA
jgi:hypothetical protein